MASTNPYAEEKEHVLFVYDAPMDFQIRFCLTITTSRVGKLMSKQVDELNSLRANEFVSWCIATLLAKACDGGLNLVEQLAFLRFVVGVGNHVFVS